MKYIFQYDVSAFIISLLMLLIFFGKRSMDTKINRGFFALFLTNLVASGMDLLSVYFIENPTTETLWLSYTISIWYLMALHALPIAFVDCVVNLSGRTNFPRIRHLFKTIPYAISAILIILSPFFHTVFYFDENLVYTHGTFYPVILIVSGIYLLVGIIYSVRYIKWFTADQFFLFFFYVFMSITAVIIQVFIPELLLISFAVSIATMLGFLSLNNPGLYKNKEMDIFNRKAFNIVVQNLIAKNKQFGVITIQMIGINFLNESFGIESTNNLLKKLPFLLKVAVKDGAFYRISGTRISILVQNNEEKIKDYIDRLKILFEEPFRLGNLQMPISIHATYVLCPQDAYTLEDILDLNITALQKISTKERGTVIHADNLILNQIRRKNSVFQILLQALNNHDFYIGYQPIYSLRDKRFTEVKALIRLRDDELGYISAKEFMPLAEQNGVTYQIAEFLIRGVCNFILTQKIWEKGINKVRIGFSVIQCMQKNLHRMLLEIMNAYGIDHNLITVEVTEEVISKSNDYIKNNLYILNNQKISLSLDNYGYGVSKMANITGYEFDSIKIDRSLVWAAEKNEKAKKYLEGTLTMIHSLGIDVLAEGIETQAQAEYMEKIGCNYMQGYYYSKPLIEKEFLEILK